tara:strand:+ start:822 stop:1196 length:375 start_codon:yes stop_codon:yes gene_type:complete
MGSRPKAPKPTAEELALEKRTKIGLRESQAKTERMLKAQARGQLGAKSLLGGIKPMRNLQKDVVHSDAISSERLSYDKANIFDKAKIVKREGAGRLGLTIQDADKLTGRASGLKKAIRKGLFGL